MTPEAPEKMVFEEEVKKMKTGEQIERLRMMLLGIALEERLPIPERLEAARLYMELVK